MLNLLHGDLPARSLWACAFLVLILFLYHLPYSHFINFTYPISISVSQGSYYSSVSLQVPVSALYMWCLFPFLLNWLVTSCTGWNSLFLFIIPITTVSQLTGRSLSGLIFPLVSLSNKFFIPRALLDVSFLSWFLFIISFNYPWLNFSEIKFCHSHLHFLGY